MPKTRDKLSPKEEKLCQAYAGEALGHATIAAQIAGYKCPETMGSRVLRRPRVQARLGELGMCDDLIATREELQRWWTEQMHNEDISMQDRRGCADSLAKSIGVFIQRIEAKVERVDPRDELKQLFDVIDAAEDDSTPVFVSPVGEA
jgi:hypothetical protein